MIPLFYPSPEFRYISKLICKNVVVSVGRYKPREEEKDSEELPKNEILYARSRSRLVTFSKDGKWAHSWYNIAE